MIEKRRMRGSSLNPRTWGRIYRGRNLKMLKRKPCWQRKNFKGLTPALKTDLYELTMAAGYFRNNVASRATFELFCHKSPPGRSYFIACGLEQAIDYLLNLKFSDEDIKALKYHPALKRAGKGFFEYLKKFSFTGDVWAMPEGTPFFPLEPIIQVKAPIIEAQIVETYLLSTMHLQTLVASKASRIVEAACADGKTRQVIDFGARRAHGPEAAIFAARAAYIGGCTGTSNIFAGIKFRIPTYGTMAHSWIEAFENEEEAFKKYDETFPGHATLLIDTYDTIKAAGIVARMKRNVQGVRLDSGDLDYLSRKVRKILDKAGLSSIKIIASGDLDEYKILKLVKNGAPIDIFGVGTKMVTSGDLPSLDLIYKLVETESPGGAVRYKAKYSKGKETLPGRKQVYRYYRRGGSYAKDVICLVSERHALAGRAMLKPVIKGGRLIKQQPDIDSIREYARKEKNRLPGQCVNILSGRYLKTEISHKFKILNNNIC